MRIRTKLLVLLLVTALAPLVGVSIYAQITTRALGTDLSHRARESLTDLASSGLRRLADDFGNLMETEWRAAETALRLQAQGVEGLLAADAPDLEPDSIPYATDFDGAEAPPGSTTDPRRYFRVSESGEAQPLAVNFDTAAFWLAPGVSIDDVRADVARLLKVASHFKEARKTSPDLFHWQYVALESGVHCTYPGHGGYPEAYDPRTRDWYRRARESDGMTANPPSVDASTGQVMLALSTALHRADGSVAGVTGVDLRLLDLLESVSVPEAWASGSRALVVRRSPAGTSSQEYLAVVAHQDYLRPGAPWDSPIALRILQVADDGFRKMLHDLEQLRSGVARLPYRGRDCLWGYGPINDADTALLIIVPTEVIHADALQAEEDGLVRTREQLLTTVVILLLVAVLTTVVAFRGSKVVTRPIVRLTKVARKIAAGDLHARAGIKTGDEIEELSESFDAMVPKLAEHIEIQKSLQVARDVQQNLLPRRPPRLAGFDVAGISDYCDETGGDYFDFLRFRDSGPGRLGIVVGDVVGHGIEAALLMATARASLRARARSQIGLGALLSEVNRDLSEDASAGRFMTLYYLEIDGPGRVLRWIGAGHQPALLYNPRTDEFVELAGKGLPLGIDRNEVYPEFSREGIEVGEILYIGTDGIHETRNVAKEFFGEDAVREIIRKHAGGTAEEIQTAILEAVDRFRGERPQDDDVTLVVVKAIESQDGELPATS